MKNLPTFLEFMNERLTFKKIFNKIGGGGPGIEVLNPPDISDFRKAVPNPPKFEDFEEGQVIKMEPGYYTTKPYYVEVVSVNNKSMRVHAPGTSNKDDLTLNPTEDKDTWEYQNARMTIMGDKKQFGHLLKHQKYN